MGWGFGGFGGWRVDIFSTLGHVVDGLTDSNIVQKLLLSGESPKHIVMLLPLQGATAPTRGTQGAATLALGYGLHWAFSPLLQKHFYHIAISNEALYCSFGIVSPLRIDK